MRCICNIVRNMSCAAQIGRVMQFSWLADLPINVAVWCKVVVQCL